MISDIESLDSYSFCLRHTDQIPTYEIFSFERGKYKIIVSEVQMILRFETSLSLCNDIIEDKQYLYLNLKQKFL